MPTVIVTALYDENLNFFPPSGELKQVDASSLLLGYRNLPSTLLPLANTSTVQNINLLKIKDPQIGVLYLNMSLADWQAAISAVIQDSNRSISVTYVCGTDPGINPGTTFTLSEWWNITPLTISVNGTGVNMNNVTYTSDNATLTGTFVLPNALVNTNVMEIVFYNN